jgi:nitrate reductase NapE
MTLDQDARHGLDVHQEWIELAIALINRAAGHLVFRAPHALASPSAASAKLSCQLIQIKSQSAKWQVQGHGWANRSDFHRTCDVRVATTLAFEPAGTNVGRSAPCAAKAIVRAEMSKLALQAWFGDARRKQELTVFVVLALLLAPLLTIGTVGAYGLGVWMYQAIAGPPGPSVKQQRNPGIVPR